MGRIQPSVVFVNSRREIDKIWGRKTERWLTAWVKNDKIFILPPNVYLKESSHKDINHFWQTLKHEYCHLYFKKMTGINYPKWLNEGLACYLAGQTKKPPAEEEALRIFNYYRKPNWQIYKTAYFWVKLLIEKFGREKLLKLIKRLNPQMTKKQFTKNFYQIYKFQFLKEGFGKIFNQNQK